MSDTEDDYLLNVKFMVFDRNAGKPVQIAIAEEDVLLIRPLNDLDLTGISALIDTEKHQERKENKDGAADTLKARENAGLDRLFIAIVDRTTNTLCRASLYAIECMDGEGKAITYYPIDDFRHLSDFDYKFFELKHPEEIKYVTADEQTYLYFNLKSQTGNEYKAAREHAIREYHLEKDEMALFCDPEASPYPQTTRPSDARQDKKPPEAEP